MIKLLIAGPRSFTDSIRLQAQKVSNVLRIVNETTEPSTTVEVLEKWAANADGVLLGFDDENIMILADVITANKIKATTFVSTDSPATAYKKWTKYRMKIAPAGKEMDTILRFFSSKISLLNSSPQPAIDEKEDNQFLKARVGVIEERQDKNRVIAIDKKSITIFGQKGGIGKSTTTVSLAKSLSTLTNMKGCILDLDFNRDYGDIIRYFGIIGEEKSRLIEMDDQTYDQFKNVKLPTEKTLSAWNNFPWEMKLNKQLVESCLVQIPNCKNLFILPPVRNIKDAEEISYDLVKNTIEVLKRHFSFVLIDGGNTLSTATLSAMENSDEIIILSSAELCVLDGLSDFTTSTINMIQGNPIISLVINEIPANYPFDLEKDLPNITHGYPVVAMFPHDEEVFKMLSCNADIPYLGCHDLPYTQEMKKLLYHIFPKEAFKGKEVEKSNSFLGGFFKKWNRGNS